MGQIYVGCTLDRLPHPKAAAALPFFEYAPRAPLPTYATLARFRKRVGERTAVSLVCPKSTWSTPKGPMRPGPELDAGIEWISRVADILDARAIVLATGAELTTGARDKGLLADVVARLKQTKRLIVVAPQGLWETEDGAAYAQSIGAVYGFDPLESDAPAGSPLYARVRPMGARPRLSEGHLAQIAERVVSSEAEEAFVSVDSEQAYRDFKRLTRAMGEAQEHLDDEDDELEQLLALEDNEDEDEDDEGNEEEDEPDED